MTAAGLSPVTSAKKLSSTGYHSTSISTRFMASNDVSGGDNSYICSYLDLYINQVNTGNTREIISLPNMLTIP